MSPCSSFLYTNVLLSVLFTTPQEKQYAQWMAACKLASKGLTMADNSFESEVKSIQTFLSMQRTNPGSQVTQTDDNINTLSLVSPRYQKKYKAKQVHELYDFFSLQDRMQSRKADRSKRRNLTLYRLTYHRFLRQICFQRSLFIV